jgi:hypothetical protein
MTPAEQAQQAVASHLQELPNAALDAALDLANQQGPAGLVFAIADEFTRRNGRLFLCDQP